MIRAQSFRPAPERGAALLASLCFATVLTIALGSYITVCTRTLEMSSRTLQGAQSVQLAETGMEEALWALNKNDWSGWTISGTTATKTLAGFTYDNNVTGQINLAVTSFDGSTGSRTVTVDGTTESPNGIKVTRTLTSSCALAPLFVNAIAATTSRVKFKSEGTVDSYDSTLGEYEAQTPTYSAVVSSGSVSTSSATVQMTNVQIKGFVATQGTGPSYGTTARLIGPITPGEVKIDQDQISTSPYQPIFNELVPTGASTLLPGGTSTIGTAGATTAQVYRATNVQLDGTNVLTIDGPVVVNISGSLSILGTAKILITTNGSLEIHLGGNLTINGNGIQNDTKLPKKLALIGTSPIKGILRMSTGMPFHGVFYFPFGNITITHSQAIYGAMIGRSVTFEASPNFHYDLSLRRTAFSGIETPYAISDWRETSNGS